MSNKKYKFTLIKAFNHLKTILIHKYYVFKYMCQCGMPIRGLFHDTSKFSITEFFTNAKYYEKGISPIEIQRKEFGYAKAWFHHKGINPHHYEYWVDKLDDGGFMTRMPFKYAVESICDNMAANKAYLGKESNGKTILEWWNKWKYKSTRHIDNRDFNDEIYHKIYDDWKKTGKTELPDIKYMKDCWNYVVSTNHNPTQMRLDYIIQKNFNDEINMRNKK